MFLCIKSDFKNRVDFITYYVNSIIFPVYLKILYKDKQVYNSLNYYIVSHDTNSFSFQGFHILSNVQN